jgi:hypothetical protein
VNYGPPPGLAAHALKRAPVDITLIDRRNFHLFQPLLYQVAFFHYTDSHMIPYLGSEFVRALLGLADCDGAAEVPLDLDDAKPPVTHAKIKLCFGVWQTLRRR